jgi:citrate lyase subunit beta/citryl-CoA lyase
MGFRGKYVIHPDHIGVVSRAFSPTKDDVAYARRVLIAARRAEREGRGAIALDGRMVDAPIVARARRTIALAERMDGASK